MRAYNRSAYQFWSWQRTNSPAGGFPSGGLKLGACSLSAHRFWIWQCPRLLRACSLGAYSWGPAVSLLTDSGAGSTFIRWGPTVWRPVSLCPPILELAVHSPAGGLQEGAYSWGLTVSPPANFWSWQCTHPLEAYSLGADSWGPTSLRVTDLGAGNAFTCWGPQSGGLQVGAYSLTALPPTDFDKSELAILTCWGPTVWGPIQLGVLQSLCPPIPDLAMYSPGGGL